MSTPFDEIIREAFKPSLRDEPSQDYAYTIIRGDEAWPAWFAVTEMANATIAMAGCQLAALAAGDDACDASDTKVSVDARLASLWFAESLQPVGWQTPPVWDPLSNNYQTLDGWLRIHCNAPVHRDAAIAVLGGDGEPEDARRRAEQWRVDALEQAIVDAGGCAAAMRSLDAWQQHEQGIAVAKEPLIHWEQVNATEGAAEQTPMSTDEPLAGVRVLDLTRILAGPVATRFLAAFGADVLRIDPPHWSEPGNSREVTLGKRCAGLNLRDKADRQVFEQLLKTADIFVHGYRPGALAGLGFDPQTIRRINPNVVDVSLDAYGWTGPWRHRRGFDSLVQMSCGIADYGMRQTSGERPHPLPVQALDHGTGYLMAAAALYALRQRRHRGVVLSARLSLARTAAMLTPTRRESADQQLAEVRAEDVDPWLERTPWGDAKRLRFPVAVTGAACHWQYAAGELRSSTAAWR